VVQEVVGVGHPGGQAIPRDHPVTQEVQRLVHPQESSMQHPR